MPWYFGIFGIFGNFGIENLVSELWTLGGWLWFPSLSPGRTQ